jgi:hypothetical protein
MKILFHDILQYSNIPEELKSPMLSERIHISEHYSTLPFNINLDKERQINSIGIGNTDGTLFEIRINNKTYAIQFTENGLYMLPETITTAMLSVNTNATYIGRLGAGVGVRIPTSIAKEPSFISTSTPRVTLSGQVIPGRGGYNYRAISLDSRYKIDSYSMKEIIDGFKFISLGYPFFIDLTDESYKLPFSKLYANDKNQQNMGFESGVRRFLYSRRFEFEERF